MKQKKLITAIVLSSLALTGCGGGGGGGGSPSAPPANVAPTNSNALNNPPQKWAPFYSITRGGSANVYGSLSVDSIADPHTQALIRLDTGTSLGTFDGPLSSLPNIDSSGMLSPITTSTGSGFIVEGTRYFLFSSNGKLYAIDLTSTTTPTAIQWGILGISQICGLQAEQFDGSGLTGDVIVSGVTSGNNCASPSTWIVPFQTSASTTITPLPFHEFLVATFISANSSDIKTTGYVVGVTQNNVSSVNYTSDPASPGTRIATIAFDSAKDTLASDLGGDATHQFVWVYHHSNTSPTTTTSNLYSVTTTPTLAAIQVSGLPPSNLSNNTATDAKGNLYIVASNGTAVPFAVDVYQVPFDGSPAKRLTPSSISVGDSSTTSILTNISVNQSGNGGMLTVTATGTTTQTNTNYVLNFTTQPAPTPIAGNDVYAMQFIGLDGSAYINNNSTSPYEVDAVNLPDGNKNNFFLNLVGISQLSSTNLLGLPNVDTVAYGSFLAQDSTGVVSVIETGGYKTTGLFSLPSSSKLFYPATLNSRPNYIMGMVFGAGGGLFAVNPAPVTQGVTTTPASVTQLGTNNPSTVTWYGY